VKWAGIQRGSPKFCLRVVTASRLFSTYLKYVIIWGSKSVCFYGKVKFCLFDQNRHGSRYLINTQLYVYSVFEKRKCCLNNTM
jgi:hypothetical protein